MWYLCRADCGQRTMEREEGRDTALADHEVTLLEAVRQRVLAR